MKSEVAPIQAVQIVVNGKVVYAQTVPPADQTGKWIELDRMIESRLAHRGSRRGHSRRPRPGAPDAEAHTNPVLLISTKRPPTIASRSTGWWRGLDQQIAAHRKRSFDEKARVAR